VQISNSYYLQFLVLTRVVSQFVFLFSMLYHVVAEKD
jgi:hypothetical protein